MITGSWSTEREIVLRIFSASVSFCCKIVVSPAAHIEYQELWVSESVDNPTNKFFVGETYTYPPMTKTRNIPIGIRNLYLIRDIKRNLLGQIDMVCMTRSFTQSGTSCVGKYSFFIMRRNKINKYVFR